MSEPTPWRDFSRSRAVLIGAADYAHLRPVPAAFNSLNRMRQVLTGPLCGWPADRVEQLADPRRRGELPDMLMAAYTDVVDVALFYFVGHGQLYNDELCLALAESPSAGPQRTTIGLPFSDVRRALRECDAHVKIVILDCCYSGHATLPGHTLSGTGEEVIDLTVGTGALTLSASGAEATAWYEKDEANGLTYFTKYLADTIERGIPDGPEAMTLGAIYTQTAQALAHDRLPAPTRSSRHDAERFPFAMNAARDPLGGIRAEIAAVQEQLRHLSKQIADLSALVAQRPAAPTEDDQRLAEKAAGNHFFATMPHPRFKRLPMRASQAHGFYEFSELGYYSSRIDELLTAMEGILSGQGPPTRPSNYTRGLRPPLEELATYLASRPPLATVKSPVHASSAPAIYAADDVDVYLEQLQGCLREYFRNRATPR